MTFIKATGLDYLISSQNARDSTGLAYDPYLVLTASNISTGRPSTAATAPGKGFGMKLGKTQKTNQFLESLKAEGEVILEDVQPSAVSTRSSALPPSDPVTVTIEEKLNVVVKRDGGINNFDVQGTLALQVLNDTDGFIQLQVTPFPKF